MPFLFQSQPEFPKFSQPNQLFVAEVIHRHPVEARYPKSSQEDPVKIILFPVLIFSSSYRFCCFLSSLRQVCRSYLTQIRRVFCFRHKNRFTHAKSTLFTKNSPQKLPAYLLKIYRPPYRKNWPYQKYKNNRVL